MYRVFTTITWRTLEMVALVNYHTLGAWGDLYSCYHCDNWKKIFTQWQLVHASGTRRCCSRSCETGVLPWNKAASILSTSPGEVLTHGNKLICRTHMWKLLIKSLIWYIYDPGPEPNTILLLLKTIEEWSRQRPSFIANCGCINSRHVPVSAPRHLMHFIPHLTVQVSTPMIASY